MSLLDVRTWFVNDSGRYDLVTDATSYADNGADKYIKAGLRWLDRQVTILNQQARMFRTLSIGNYLISLERCRSVENVYGRKEDGTVCGLTYRTMEELRRIFGKAFSEITDGLPVYFALTSLRQHDEAETDPPSTEGITSSDWRTTDGLLIMPPPNEEMVFVIDGHFDSPELSANDDENFWTANEPGVLVKAALRELEVFYRNRSGAEDWTAALSGDLMGIEKDFIEKRYGHYNKLEG